jgi:hypothetical protein
VKGPAPMSVDRVKTMFRNRGYVTGAIVSIITACWPTCIAAPLTRFSVQERPKSPRPTTVALAGWAGSPLNGVTLKSSANGITLGNPGPGRGHDHIPANRPDCIGEGCGG